MSSHPKQDDKERDPLMEALEKAAAIDGLHKGPADKIPVESNVSEEELPAKAESADDSGE